jgi:hypothetical protein
VTDSLGEVQATTIGHAYRTASGGYAYRIVEAVNGSGVAGLRLRRRHRAPGLAAQQRPVGAVMLNGKPAPARNGWTTRGAGHEYVAQPGRSSGREAPHGCEPVYGRLARHLSKGWLDGIAVLPGHKTLAMTMIYARIADRG